MVWSTNDALNGILLRDGIHEESTLKLSNFILLCNPGEQVILDIGANIGTYSIPLAREAADIRKVFSFEVQRQVFLQLCGNIFLNRLDNVYPFHFGVGEETKTIEIPKVDYTKCWNVGGFSIDPEVLSINRGDFPSNSMVGTESCEIKRIDDLRFLPKSNLVKLDVEGHELEALKGMQIHLKESGYPPIIFEAWGADWFKQKRAELFEYFHFTGYSDISMDIGEGNFLAQHVSSACPKIKFNLVDGVIQLSV
jgi:FkbM family methyltransferase